MTGRNPEVFPRPLQTCKRQFFLIDLDKRLHQRHIFRSAELDHAALLHGEKSQILDCRSLLIQLWQRNHFVSGW